MSIFNSLENAFKEHHIINDFLFPGSSANSYSWNSFKPQELICIRSDEDENVVVPCLLIKGKAPRKAHPTRRDMEEETEESIAQAESDPSSTIMIYCHANSEDLGSIYACAQWISHMLGVHVLVPEYPGYGLCQGNPCESSVNTAVLTACKWVRDVLCWDLDHIVVYGRSIGTGPAINAARLGLVGGVILVSPYTSIRDIVEEHVGAVFSWLTAGSSDWPSVEMMKEVKCPVLLIHGTTDEIIPASHSKELHSVCNSRKRLILLEKVGHQEMELLYALVQAAPTMFSLYDKPCQLDLKHLSSTIVEFRGGEAAIPVYSTRTVKSPDEVMAWGENAGQMMIAGKHVFVL